MSRDFQDAWIEEGRSRYSPNAFWNFGQDDTVDDFADFADDFTDEWDDKLADANLITPLPSIKTSQEYKNRYSGRARRLGRIGNAVIRVFEPLHSLFAFTIKQCGHLLPQSPQSPQSPQRSVQDIRAQTPVIPMSPMTPDTPARESCEDWDIVATKFFQSVSETPCLNTCFMRRGRKRRARQFLAECIRRTRDVYLFLVERHILYGSDISVSHDRKQIHQHGCHDFMGVLFACIAVLRYVLSNELLEDHGIDQQMREVLAAVLIVVYKAKADVLFEGKDHFFTIIFAAFLTSDERYNSGRGINHEHLNKNISILEVELLRLTPFHSCMECSPHATFEWSIYGHTQRVNHPILDIERLLSVGFFFYHAAAVNDEAEQLEELNTIYDVVIMGQALGMISIAAVGLHDGMLAADVMREIETDLTDGWIPTPRPDVVKVCAAHFVRIAHFGLVSNPGNLRFGAYANTKHAWYGLVSLEMVAKLSNLFGMVEYLT